MKAIAHLVKYLTEKYINEYGISCDMINQGDCKIFAEQLYQLALDVGIDGEILSDGLFYDPFNDEPNEMMLDINEYGNKPLDFDVVGLPSHCWFYYNGKHYDSDTPQGVTDVFELPTIRDFYKKQKV